MFLNLKSANTEFQVVLDSERDTVWATEQQIIDLFGKSRRIIGEHIKNIYAEGELDKESTWWESHQVQKEGEREVEILDSKVNCEMVVLRKKMHLQKNSKKCNLANH